VTLSLTKLAWYMKLYQARAGIIVSGVSLLVSIDAVELGIRMFDPFGISYYEHISQYSSGKVADDQLVFKHKPSWETRYGDVLVTYNNRGLRDRPILPKAEEEYRILTLGDSVTFGWGVPQDQVFPSRLEQLLPGRIQRPVRVINGGVCGYNTIQEVTYFKREGVALQPDLVLLTYVTNDIEENRPFRPSAGSSFREKSLPEMMMKVVRSLWFYRLAHHAYHYGWYRQLKEQPLDHLQSTEGWRQSMSALRELVAICEENKIPLIVFFKRFNTRENQQLFEEVDRNTPGYPVKDMGEWFEGRDITKLVNSKVDGHVNAKGHQLIAEGMVDEIVGSIAAPQSIDGTKAF
jgi:lysophospholipase L1-like esterase